jgi:hypothetical protein
VWSLYFCVKEKLKKKETPKEKRSFYDFSCSKHTVFLFVVLIVFSSVVVFCLYKGIGI